MLEPSEEEGKPPDSGTAGSQVGEQLLAQARRVVAGTYAQGLAEVSRYGVRHSVTYTKARPNRSIAIQVRFFD